MIKDLERLKAKFKKKIEKVLSACEDKRYYYETLLHYKNSGKAS